MSWGAPFTFLLIVAHHCFAGQSVNTSNLITHSGPLQIVTLTISESESMGQLEGECNKPGMPLWRFSGKYRS